MKIIENGTLTGRDITCPSCGCTFRVGPDDAPDYTLEGMDGVVLEVCYRCPQCLHLTHIVLSYQETTP